VTSSVTELRAGLRERLPDYMVPSAFVWLDQFPLTPSRKIDRKALPSPEPVAAGAQFVAPRDDLERVVGGIFAEVLGVERVGVEDDFFELGGHSLHATSVLAKLESTFGVAVDLRAFFLTPTVAHTAATLTTDASHRARVQKVAQLRARLAAMSPAEVAAELAARRGRGENGSR
jgi:acyl carrier protein